MGYKFMLLKASHEKAVRARRRAEKFGEKPDLFTRLIPNDQQTRFRCHLKDGAQPPSKGDPLLLFISGDGVTVHKQVKEIGDIKPEGLQDFMNCFAGPMPPEVHLAEAAGDPDPFDSSFDIILRPPW